GGQNLEVQVRCLTRRDDNALAPNRRVAKTPRLQRVGPRRNRGNRVAAALAAQSAERCANDRDVDSRDGKSLRRISDDSRDAAGLGSCSRRNDENEQQRLTE